MPEKISAEQKARDMLERCGVEDAQSFSAEDVVDLIAGVPAPPTDEVLTTFAALPLPVRMRAAAPTLNEATERTGPRRRLGIERLEFWTAQDLVQFADQWETEGAANVEKERLIGDIRYILGYAGTDIPSAVLMLLERFDITPKEKP